MDASESVNVISESPTALFSFDGTNIALLLENDAYIREMRSTGTQNMAEANTNLGDAGYPFSGDFQQLLTKAFKTKSEETLTYADNGQYMRVNVRWIAGDEQDWVGEAHIYNISNNHNYVNYLRQNNQTWITYNVKNNIIVDCQRSGSFIRGINGNSNDNDCKCTWNVDNNMINYGGSDVSATEVTNMNSTKYADKNPRVKNCIAGTVTFADADKGDFSQTGVNAGDPRWKK